MSLELNLWHNSAATVPTMQSCRVCDCNMRVVCLGFVFELLSIVVAHCCSVLSLPPIKGGLQQNGEGCDGRLVQALLSDASRLECCQLFFQ